MRREAHINPESFVLWPDAGKRAALQSAPDETAVATFVMTRSAERAWHAINRALAGRGSAFFFIGGPPGSGKTHFLNYVLALQVRAGSLENATSRQVVIAIEARDGARAVTLESQMMEQMVAALEVSRRTGLLWRQMRGADALKVALDQARRMGVGRVVIALDLKDAEAAPFHPMFTRLAKVADSLRMPRLLLLAAGRGGAPAGLGAFEVAPAGTEEFVAAAVGRARRLNPDAGHQAASFYRGIDTEGYSPEAIFPFHPAALSLLRVLANPPGTVGALSALIHHALAREDEPFAASRLLMPCDLMASRAIADQIEARLGEVGRTAFKMARAAAVAAGESEAGVAEPLVATLMLESLGGRSPVLSTEELRALIPRNSDRPAPHSVAQVLSALEARAGGVIRSDPQGVRFDPRAAGAPEVAAFNAALKLALRFDSALSPAQERPELSAKLKRLGDAMDNALEAAHRVRETLRAALAAVHQSTAPEDERTLAAFIALTEAGPDQLIEAGCDPRRRQTVEAAIDAYQALAEAVALIPRAARMTEYIGRTGLDARAAQSGEADDARAATLATEGQLLRAELDPAALLRASRNIDAIEARFQKFRWSYAALYREAHRKWRGEAEILAERIEDLRRHLEALTRLNAIAALGAPQGEELAETAAKLGARIVRCDLKEKLAPENDPRCACGYVLGAPSPAREVAETFEKVRRTLRNKLAEVSRSAILRIIREHDRSHRLEGFLKITQAAQTDALIRVFDGELAGYLARLLEENVSGAQAANGSAQLGEPVPRLVRTSKPPRRSA